MRSTKFDIVIAIGPAGTGKTYLAMAMAVAALTRKQISRIILARPAVEAGEKLGFLPGDMYAKVNPYLRPLYDALYDMMDVERANRLIERGEIEIAAAGLHARTDAERLICDPRRGAKRDGRTDEDVSDPIGLQFQSRCDGRYHASRPSVPTACPA